MKKLTKTLLSLRKQGASVEVCLNLVQEAGKDKVVVLQEFIEEECRLAYLQGWNEQIKSRLND